MLQFREVRQSDLSAISSFLLTVNDSISKHMGHLHQSMVLERDGEVIGFGAMKLIDENSAYLVQVAIAHDERGKGFGDGLVKALLNTAELRGLKWVFSEHFKDYQLGSFTESVGFVDVNNHPQAKQQAERLNISPQYQYVAVLPDYFDTACHSKRLKKA